MSSDDPTVPLTEHHADSAEPSIPELLRRIRALEELVARRGYDTRPIYEKHEGEIIALQQAVEVLKAALARAGISLLAGGDPQPDDKSLDPAEDDTPLLTESQAVFFSQRMAKAFPGVRRLHWLDDRREALRRLAIVFSPPLTFKVREGERSTPLWWWRGNRNDPISRFEVLSETKCLVNDEELDIDRLAVYRGADSCRDFIYLEARPEPATGVYDYPEGHLDQQIAEQGFAYEAYGLFGTTAISREEFDDGAALIDGQIVETAGQATSRIRYLSKYNLLIAPQLSPINCQDADDEIRQLLDGLLQGSHGVDDLLGLIESLPPHDPTLPKFGH
ncbi:MAG TPA: hypothetical protein VKA60_14065 [Blastocatellia bacterium]|nr:hypothetical protein [Blastocatellia bacterium]